MIKEKTLLIGGVLLLLVGLTVIGGGLWQAAQAQSTGPTEPAETTGQTAAPRSPDSPVWTGYTYQGYIEKDDEPFTGHCDLAFDFSGNLPHTQTFDNVSVDDGHFSVLLSGNLISDFDGFTFVVKAACPAGGTLVTLGGPQSAVAVPLAHSLLADSLIYNPGWGCTFRGFNDESDLIMLFGCVPQGRSQDFPDGGGDGLDAKRGVLIGSSIYESNQTVYAGLNTWNIHYGLRTDNAVQGFLIEDSVSGGTIRRAQVVGLAIDQIGGDGIRISSTGQEGVEVHSTGSIGVRVHNAGDRGFYTQDSGGSGLSIYNAGNHGVYVDGSAQYAGVFYGNVYISGACNGCTLANFAINSGDVELLPGTLVTAVGVVESEFAVTPLLQVRPAAAGEPVIGVVVGLAQPEIDAETRLPMAETAAGAASDGTAARMLVAGEGPVAPGAYLTIARDGLVQVRVDAATATTITPGTYLIAGRLDELSGNQPGLAMAMDAADQAAGATGSIGVAMSAPDANGLVWTMFTVR